MSLVDWWVGTPPFFADVWQIKDFKSNDFGCVARKGVMGDFFGCVARKEVSSEMRLAGPGVRDGEDDSNGE